MDNAIGHRGTEKNSDADERRLAQMLGSDFILKFYSLPTKHRKDHPNDDYSRDQCLSSAFVLWASLDISASSFVIQCAH